MLTLLQVCVTGNIFCHCLSVLCFWHLIPRRGEGECSVKVFSIVSMSFIKRSLRRGYEYFSPISPLLLSHRSRIKLPACHPLLLHPVNGDGKQARK